MATEAPNRRLTRYWAPFSIFTLGTAILGYELSTDVVSETVYHMGMNMDGLAVFLEQINMGHWDPEDPDDFKKMIRILIALGFSAATIAALVRVNKEEVDGWQGGKAPKRNPGMVMSIIERVLRQMFKRK